MASWLGNLVDGAGTGLNLPELGFSELFAGGNKTANTGRIEYLGPDYNGTGTAANRKAFDSAVTPGVSAGSWNEGAPVTFGALGPLGSGLSPQNTGQAAGAGSGSGYTAADTRAYYDDTISQIDRLLAGIGTQRDAGLSSLAQSLSNERTKLQNKKTQTMQGYDEQSLQNAQEKQKGLGQVDSFANQNYTSLQRLLNGANAGSSSVARELIPYLVSKAAGTRRTGVFDTAGKNEQDIVSARKGADDQFNTAFGELDDQGRSQEQQFRQNILNEENRLLSQKAQAEMERARATGAGYSAARSAAAGTQGEINSRQDALNNLFSQFKPQFQQKALDFKKPELGQFTVDRAAVQTQNQGLPTESSYYLSQLKKKQQENF